jgi:Protein of unknown function (DUF3761)
MTQMLKKFFLLLISVFLPLNFSVAYGSEPILPISSVTPGAINSNITQANIQSTICIDGYTATIRPPDSYTTNLKRKQLAGSYSFYHDSNLADYEEDHLISLEIGGSPTDPKNLWPEPYAGATGARVKDLVENKLHDLVCSGKMLLATAQKAIASNWYLAYQKYVLGMPGSNDSGQNSTQPGVTGAAPAQPRVTSSPPPGATGKCLDGTYSFSTTHRGMCSKHGGVAQFYP